MNNLFVLTGYNLGEEVVVMGVYTSRDAADAAVTEYRINPSFYFDTYFVNQVTVDAPAIYHGDGDLIQIDLPSN